MQLNILSATETWLSVRFRLRYAPLLKTCDSGGAEKDAAEGSIKNWPSILRCCLGGVRGTGQIGFTVRLLGSVVESQSRRGTNGTVDGGCELFLMLGLTCLIIQDLF